MKHLGRVSVRRAQVDPEQQQEEEEEREAFLDFVGLTVFRVLVAAVAVVKAI